MGHRENPGKDGGPLQRASDPCAHPAPELLSENTGIRAGRGLTAALLRGIASSDRSWYLSNRNVQVSSTASEAPRRGLAPVAGLCVGFREKSGEAQGWSHLSLDFVEILRHNKVTLISTFT